MDLFDDLPEPVNQSEQKRNQTSDAEESNEQMTKRRRSDGEKVTAIKLVGYVAARKGERDGMEDAHVLYDDFSSQLLRNQEDLDTASAAVDKSAISFYGVFDGHGGSRAANYAATNLHRNFALTFKKEVDSYLEKDITKMFLDAFKRTDEDFLKEATKQKPAWKDGSTALTIVAVADVIYIANLGDSKAVLCRFNNEQKKCLPIALSKDHSPMHYEERMRIQKLGGHVREGRVMGILEVSRSIGDGQYKTIGVTCVPDIKRCQLNENDRFIIMACDGLWKVFSPEASINFVLEIVEDEEYVGTEGKTTPEMRFEMAAAKLSSEAVRRGSGDNVTVILIDVKHS